VLLLGWDGRPQTVGGFLLGKEALSRDFNGLLAYFDTWGVVSVLWIFCFAVTVLCAS
jgi:hypothetical protein